MNELFSFKQNENPQLKRRFSVYSAVLVSSLQIGCGGAAVTQMRQEPVIVPSTSIVAIQEKPVEAKATEPREVEGKVLQVIELERPLSKLDKETEKYREPEQIPNGTSIGMYFNNVRVPGEVKFLVGLDHADVLKKNHAKVLHVIFPADRESNPNAEGAGMRELDLKEFATYVRRVAGQDMMRVKIIIESGTFQYKGNETTWTNAYILPLDAQGNLITRRGNGKYVIYGATYYADVTGGGPRLLAEPNNTDTIAQK